MNIIGKLKKTSNDVLTRARHDDLLYLFLELAGGAAVVSFPALGAAAIFINLFQNHQKSFSPRQLRNSYDYFKRRGWINIESRQGDTFITMTQEGRKRADLFGAGKILSGKIKD